MVSNVTELDEQVGKFVNSIWKEAVGDLNELFDINSDLKQITIEQVFFMLFKYNSGFYLSYFRQIIVE